MKTETSKYKVTSDHQHTELLAKVDELMRRGEQNVTPNESEEIRQIGLALQEYELQTYPISAPKTLEGMIELRMYEMRLKQKDLAETLGISPVKLSMIINGKQKPDVAFIKAIYQKLNVPADFILEHI